jgi:hypothetical protein
VIGFQKHQVHVAELGLHIGWNVAQVRSDCHPNPFGLEYKPYRVRGVVWDRERAYGNIPDLEGAASLKVLNRGEPCWIRLGRVLGWRGRG